MRALETRRNIGECVSVEHLRYLCRNAHPLGYGQGFWLLIPSLVHTCPQAGHRSPACISRFLSSAGELNCGGKTAALAQGLGQVWRGIALWRYTGQLHVCCGKTAEDWRVGGTSYGQRLSDNKRYPVTLIGYISYQKRRSRYRGDN